MDPKLESKLRAASDAAAEAKETAGVKWAAFEAARDKFAQAEVPAGKNPTDLAEFKAAEEARTEYEAAAKKSKIAEDAVAALTAMTSDSDRNPKIAGAPAIGGKFPDETHGFESLGEFVRAIRFEPAKLANHGIEYRAEQSIAGDGTDGGYLVPSEFERRILEMPGSNQIVRPRALVIPASGESPDADVDIPSLDQTGAGGMYGGVAVFWQDEETDDDVPGTGANLKDVNLKPSGATGAITVTNKLMRNAAWATPIYERLLSAALVGSEDHKFLSGDGIGCPLGVRSSTGMKYVNRDTASKVLVEDVLAMIGALHPDSIDTAVFVACQGLRSQIMGLKDHAGNRVYVMGDPTKGIADTLFGIPVLYTGKTAAVGAKGDLLLVDFSYYLIKDGMGLTISVSEHVKFMRNRTVIKINRSVDGKGWVTGPMVLEDGTTQVAPYVGLDLVAG